jgi:hypothetical protein
MLEIKNILTDNSFDHTLFISSLEFTKIIDLVIENLNILLNL